MNIDFSQTKLTPKAFSDLPMQFGHAATNRELAATLDLIAIETGPRRVREKWQKAQLRNLFSFAAARSPIWRKRIKSATAGDAVLQDLPIQTRADVVAQVRSEGSLLRLADKLSVAIHSTSGSSGTPVKFYYSQMNGDYNVRRSWAQFFIENRRLDTNFTRARSLDLAAQAGAGPLEGGFKTAWVADWLGPLSQMYRSGRTKLIEYVRPDPKAVFKELLKDEVGYFVAQPHFLESIFQKGDVSVLSRSGTVMVLPISGALDAGLRQRIVDQGIPVRGTYSCEEIGLIGSECSTCPEHYHVAGSNVVVEVDGTEVVHDGVRLGRILITHLHSYATPFIRYDVGDVGQLTNTCKCGFDGPTVSNLMGRSKYLVKHRDGRLTPFLIRAHDLFSLGDFPEYRIRQTCVGKILMEIGGCSSETTDLVNACENLVRGFAGDDFEVDVRCVPQIDWGQSVKRPIFTNEII